MEFAVVDFEFPRHQLACLFAGGQVLLQVYPGYAKCLDQRRLTFIVGSKPGIVVGKSHEICKPNRCRAKHYY
jgi:hypothetical protein